MARLAACHCSWLASPPSLLSTKPSRPRLAPLSCFPYLLPFLLSLSISHLSDHLCEGLLKLLRRLSTPTNTLSTFRRDRLLFPLDTHTPASSELSTRATRIRASHLLASSSRYPTLALHQSFYLLPFTWPSPLSHLLARDFSLASHTRDPHLLASPPLLQTLASFTTDYISACPRVCSCIHKRPRCKHAHHRPYIEVQSSSSSTSSRSPHLGLHLLLSTFAARPLALNTATPLCAGRRQNGIVSHLRPGRASNDIYTSLSHNAQRVDTIPGGPRRQG